MIIYNSKKDKYYFNQTDIDFFINVGFVLTQKCNLKCIHCCEKFNLAETSIVDIKKIIDDLAKNKLTKICITGGEPLLKDNLLEILEYIHSKKIKITFSTNGMLINEKNLSQIKPFIDNIRFSIYGREDIHNKVTLNNMSFRNLINSLKIANELKISIGLVMTVLNSNLESLKDVLEICNKYSVEKLYLYSLMPTERGAKIYSDEYISSKNIVKYLKELNFKCISEVKVKDWAVEGQCVLIYSNGDIMAQPSYSDEGNKKLVGNMFKKDIKLIWEDYPFKTNYINYYNE